MSTFHSTLISTLVLLSLSARGAPIKEWDAKPDGATVSGKQAVTVRFTPGETRSYEMLVFEVPLRQSYDRTDSLGKTVRRNTQPAVFVYREKNVKMVTDLDKYISFWVPIGLEQVREAYGPSLFVDAPVQMGNVRITAMEGDKKLWTIEAAFDGTVNRAATAPAPAKAPVPRPAGSTRP